MIVTLSERRAKEVERLRSAAGHALDELSAYALEQGGRFVVFGSFPRGDPVKSAPPLEAAVRLVSSFPADVASFRKLVDP